MRISPLKLWGKLPKIVRSKKTPAVFGILIIAYFILTRGAQDITLIETKPVEQKTLQTQVSAPGVVASQSSATSRFSTSGKLVWLGIEEGQYVYAGQAIASIDAEPFQIALRQAQQDVTGADAVLSQVYDEQKKQTAAENFDQKIRRTAAETTKNKAFDAAKRAQFDLRNTTIYAPQNGTVTEVNFVAGEEVNPTSEIAKIDNTTNLEFIGQVDEIDIGRVLPNQEATITLDAFADNPLSSYVGQIAQRAVTSTTGATAFEVTMTLPKTQNYLIGMNGQAEIVINKKEHVVTIPLEAIVDENFVWVKENNSFTKRSIQKGLESDTEVEITSGLKKDEHVVTNGFDQIDKKSVLQRLLKK